MHRVSWELHNNPIPDGLCVLHKCDVRNCINPKHLFLGSHKDNMQDMARKGRGVGSTLKGDKCGASKLKEAEVKDIKALINDGYSDAAIAIKYNVIRQTINMIRNSKTWKHIK